MADELAMALDECIARVNQGETIESCLVEYPGLRGRLESLLYTAFSVYSIPHVSPSDEFKIASKARLMRRIDQELSHAKAVESASKMSLSDGLATAWRNLSHIFVGGRKAAVLVTLSVIVALGISLGVHNLKSAPVALASQCTLTIFSGSAEVYQPESVSGQQGVDSMVLTVGTKVKTLPASHALLTFFDGTTVKLEPDTVVEIQQLEVAEEESTTIVLRQMVGRTWSRVTKMIDPGSHYEIKTPTASAVVRGTMFATEVDEIGSTKVTTTEGLVSVVSQGEEVQLPANQQTRVEEGKAPIQPLTVLPPKSEILINIDMAAVGSVTDHTGSSTGSLPDGFAFNQISGSKSSSTPENTQLITITEPITGEYTVALRFLEQETANCSIRFRSEDSEFYTFIGNFEAVHKGGWLIRLVLEAEDGRIVNAFVSSMEPFEDEAPEKVVKPGSFKEKAAKVGPSQVIDDQNSNAVDEGTYRGGEAKGQDKPEEKDNSEDMGNTATDGVVITGVKNEGGGTDTQDKGAPPGSEDKGKGDDNDKGKGQDKLDEKGWWLWYRDMPDESSQP